MRGEEGADDGGILKQVPLMPCTLLPTKPSSTSSAATWVTSTTPSPSVSFSLSSY